MTYIPKSQIKANGDWANISPSIRTGKMNAMSDEDQEELINKTRECL